jgi:flavin reductase (DIM6/NTAB) family NADH-FMN oxidoreductase RutF
MLFVPWRFREFGAHRNVAALASAAVKIQPKILYFGTPVVLLTTENADGTANLAPMSSAWTLGQVVVLGRRDHSQVRPPRVAECRLQLEARAERTRLDAGGDFLIVEARVLAVHADPGIVVPGTDHVDPNAWSPLIYNIRHYFGVGDELGRTYRSETA